MFKLLGVLVAGSWFVVGCSSTVNVPGAAGAGGASSTEIADCKQSCDKMKFFDCNSADEQARCHGDCDKASPSQVRTFTGCAGASICDPACRTTIQPADAPKQGTGATPSSCETACAKLASCSLIPVGQKSACETECEKTGYQYQIDCAIKTACDKLVATCGGGENVAPPSPTGTAPGTPPPTDTFASQECEQACDKLNFFECGTVQDHATCRAKCSSAAAAPRDTFTACARSSGADCPRLEGCLDTFTK